MEYERLTRGELIVKLVAAERMFAETCRHAQEALRARDNLLAVVSHDLRNYLTMVRTGAELLSRLGPAAEARAFGKHIESIKRAATAMDELIECLRDATMMETGRFTVDAKPEDVASLAKESLVMLGPHADARTVRLRTELADGLPPVRCDRQRVLQVIANLVGNALKFTDRGGEIRVAAKPDGETVCFSVSDTGKGIPAADLASVFDKHWKGAQESNHGTGLGLFIAKGIVEAHGGQIWADSQVGVGSTFRFTLPLSRGAASGAARSPVPAKARGLAKAKADRATEGRTARRGRTTAR